MPAKNVYCCASCPWTEVSAWTFRSCLTDITRYTARREFLATAAAATAAAFATPYASVTEGKWWDKDYSGEPLVSFSEEEGKALGRECREYWRR